jgi:hypothetical protein
MSTRFRLRFLALLPVAAVALLLGGCAVAAPNNSTLSGKQMVVTLTFNAPIDPTQHYFFLINNAGSQNANGPVPVFVPPYGNGFATGSAGGVGTSTTAPGGFTDFVEFDNDSQGYALYHVINGDPNKRANFVLEGRPVSYTIPDYSGQTNPQSAYQLQFTLDFSQFIYNSNGQPLSSQSQTVSAALAIQWLQINMISTDQIPINATTDVGKKVDALGNTLTPNQSTFLVLNAQNNQSYTNSQYVGSPVYEPANDVYNAGSSDGPIDLVNWTIQVQQN